MKQITLTQGYIAIVDDEDYDRLIKWKWHIEKSRNTFYARRNVTTDKGQRPLKMHMEIMGTVNTGLICDHINGNGLGNRKSNLRICNHNQNMRNRISRVNRVSKYKGVSMYKNVKVNKWKAHIRVNGKLINLGRFSTEHAAAMAYDTAALKYHKEFANLNFK